MSRNEQLRILSIFHYVVGGMHAFFGSFGLLHFFIGISFLVNPSPKFLMTSPEGA